MVLNGPDGAVAAAQSQCSGEVVAHIEEAVKEKDANHRNVVKKFGSSCRKLYPHFVYTKWKDCLFCATTLGSPFSTEMASGPQRFVQRYRFCIQSTQNWLV